jgi:hypothetical protein
MLFTLYHPQALKKFHFWIQTNWCIIFIQKPINLVANQRYIRRKSFKSFLNDMANQMAIIWTANEINLKVNA